MIPATPVRGIIPVAAAGTAETVMDAGDTAVKSAAMETTGVVTAAVETAAVPSAAASVGEIWLAEDSHVQYRSCNTRHSL